MLRGVNENPGSGTPAPHGASPPAGEGTPAPASAPGEDLRGARLDGADLRSRTFARARLADARLDGACLDAVDLTEADLADAWLPRASLRGACLRGATLARVNGPGSDWYGAILESAALQNADLEAADLSAARLAGARLDGARLRGADLSAADLTAVQGRLVVFDRANLERARLDRARLPEAAMGGARLAGATLTDADLRGADLRGADLRDADLRGVRLDRARLEGARLEGARLEGVRSQKLRIPPELPLSADQVTALVAGGGRIAPAAHKRLLARTRTAGARLRALDWGAPLRLAGHLSRLGLRGLAAAGRAASRTVAAWARSARRLAGDVIRSPLEDLAPGASMAGRDFSGLHLAERDLRGVDFTSARLVGVDLSGADLRGARLARADMAGALLVDTHLEDADLSGAILAHAVLRGATMDRADLSEARLARADLRRASLEGVRARAALLQDASLQGANLSNADLREASFEGADLLRCTWTDADVTGTFLGRNPTVEIAVRDQLVAKGAVLTWRPGTRLRKDLEPVIQRLRDFRERLRALIGRLHAALAARRAARAERARLAALALEGPTAPPSPEPASPPPLPAEPATLVAPAPEPRPAEAPPVPHHLADAPPVVRAPPPSTTDASRPEESFDDEVAPSTTRRRTWGARLSVATAVGLVAFLGWRFAGPSSVTDTELEAQAGRAAEGGDGEAAASRYEALAARATDANTRAGWLLEAAAVLAREDRSDPALDLLAEARDLPGLDAEARGRVTLRLAEVLATSGRPMDALPLYEAMLDDPLGTPETLASVLVGMGDACAILHFRERSSIAWTQAMTRFPENPEVALAVARRASEALLARDRYAEALGILQKVPGDRLEPTERASWLVATGRVLDDMGQAEQAVEAYGQALRYLSGSGKLASETRFRLARLLHARGDTEAANQLMADLDSAATPPDIRGRALLLQADVLYRSGRMLEAEELYRRITREWAEDETILGEARAGLGTVMVSVGGAEQVASLLETLGRPGQVSQAAADVLLGHAQGLLDQGKPEAALAILDRVAVHFTAEDRWGQATLNGRAGALIQLGRFQEALDALRLLRTRVKGADAVRLDGQIADILLRSGRVEDAALAWRSILEVAGAESQPGLEATLGLGRVAEAQGHNETAIQSYSRVIQAAADTTLRSAALNALAGLHLDLGQDEQAMDAYRRYLDLCAAGSPEATAARLSMADIYGRRGEPAREEALLREVLDQDASSLGQARASVRLAELALRQGRAQEVLPILDALPQDDALPADVLGDMVFLRASTLLQLGRADEALDLATAAVDDPANAGSVAPFVELQRQALVALGRTSDAEALGLAEGQETTGEEPGPALTEALQVRDGGDADRAIRLLRELLDQQEDRASRASILREIAAAQGMAGEREAARGTLRRIQEEYADLPEAVFIAGFSLAEMDMEENDPRAALARYQVLVPPDEGHRLWLAEAQAKALAAAGDTDGARKAWRAILDGWASDPAAAAGAWSGLGELAMQTADAGQALAAFRRAATIAPDGPIRDQARLRVATASMEAGDLTGALAAVKEMNRSSLDPETAVQAQLVLSGILQERGEWKAALEAAEAVDRTRLAAGFAPQVADARAVCLMALDRMAEAEEVYRELEADWPTSPDARATAALGLAEVAARQGDMDLATRRFEAVAEGAIDRFRQAQALLRLAQLLEERGRTEAAGQYYRRVRDQYEDEPEMAEAARNALE